MKVNIHYNDDWLSYTAEPSDTVASLKRQIQETEGLLVEEQLLWTSSTTLENRCLLSDYVRCSMLFISLQVVPLSLPPIVLLGYACRKPDYQRIKILLARGLPLDQLNSLDTKGAALIHIAAETKNLNLFHMLNAKGVNLNQVNSSGQTPLHIVAELGHLPTANFLIKHTVNLNVKDQYGNTPLHAAAYNLQDEMVELLCQSGARLNMLNKNGDAAVHIAARNPEGSDCIFALGNAEVKIDVKNSRTGETALFVAAANGHLEVVKTLLKLGADPTTRNAKGISAIDAARKNGHDDVVSLLEDHDEDALVDIVRCALDNLSVQLIPTADLERIQAEKAALVDEVTALKEANVRAVNQQSILRVSYNQLQQELERVRKLSESQQKENDQLHRQNQAQQAEITKLEALVSQTNVHQSVMQGRCDQMEQTRASTESRAGGASDTARQLELANRRLEEARRDREFSNNKVIELTKQVKALQKAPTAAPAACTTCEELREQLRESESSHEKTKTVFAEITTRLVETHMQLEESKDDQEIYRYEIEQLEKQITSLKTAAARKPAPGTDQDQDGATIRADNAQYQHTIRELEARVAQLQAVVDQPNCIPYGQFGW